MDEISYSLLTNSFAKSWKSYEKVKKEIIKNILNNKPFSFIRLGDGELHIIKEFFNINNHNQYFITEGSLGIYNKSIGDHAVKIHNEIIDILCERRCIKEKRLRDKFIIDNGKWLLKAIQKSTYIGIFNEDDFTEPIMNTISTHSYVPQIELLAACGCDFRNLVPIKLNRDPIFSDPHKLRELLNNRPIHIMCSNADVLKNETKLHEVLNCDISYTNIPHYHGSLMGFSLYHRNTIVNSKLSEIKEDLVIYALGGGCKDIPRILSNQYNKMVLDLGSVVDGWGGKITRPYMEEDNYIILNKNFQ